ncbi:MAG: S-methyl-5-thioribose-1-phosphate isomerase [Actinobacteria bacterium]|nr:S-methyl-5-thioribose-1-phosphate isomerase [Actinomycetota bacterium]
MKNQEINTVLWDNGILRLIDQRALPFEEKYLYIKDYRDAAEAIITLAVRGAPAIGVTAAFAVVLAANQFMEGRKESFFHGIDRAISELAGTRPTAVNLFWALARMRSILESHLGGDPEVVAKALEEEAISIYNDDISINAKLSENGSALIKDGYGVLTHCNTGALATAGRYGTALGVIRWAHNSGKKIHVYVDETRPVLQGARLTAWELSREEIPMTLITDNTAGYVMSLGKVNAVFVGADRIALNGDTANKIGTFSLSVLAKSTGIPFYVVAPLSTVDAEIGEGKSVKIEQRDSREVTEIAGVRIAPEGVSVFNPAFDVTPHRNITAIITEVKVVRPPFYENLPEIKTGCRIEAKR